MSLVMYDSINLDQFVGLTMDAAAGYVDGNWQTFWQLPNYVPAGTKLVSITVFGNDADCVDQEPGNIEPGPAAAWIAARVGKMPILYTGASNVQNMINLISAEGVARNQYRIWSAHYTYYEHICNPNVCGYTAADATQWTDKAHGRNLDQSILPDNFFGPPKPAPPKPKTIQQIPEDLGMLVTFGSDKLANLPMPNNVISLRLCCAQGGTCVVRWMGTGKSQRQTFSDTFARWDYTVPSDQKGYVQIQDEGLNGPLYVTWLVPVA